MDLAPGGGPGGPGGRAVGGPGGPGGLDGLAGTGAGGGSVTLFAGLRVRGGSKGSGTPGAGTAAAEAVDDPVSGNQASPSLVKGRGGRAGSA